VFVQVVVDAPIEQPLDYRLDSDSSDSAAQRCGSGNALAPDELIGRICVVPLGRRKVCGVIVRTSQHASVELARIRTVERVLASVAPLSPRWLQLTQFAADYYQHAWGELAVPALPPLLRSPPGPRFDASLKRMRKPTRAVPVVVRPLSVILNEDQRAAVEAVGAAGGFVPWLLFGVTGSGKTEVYLEAMAQRLAADAAAQVLLLVPEINLTPQLLARVQRRFPGEPIVALHSGLPDGERSAAWMAAHEGRARIVIGTRLAVFASLPALALIVVDEEHDPSFKAGDGARYSARDLAVKRAQDESIALLLGSATPSLETWAHAQAGRYRMLVLSDRAGLDARSSAEDGATGGAVGSVEGAASGSLGVAGVTANDPASAATCTAIATTSAAHRAALADFAPAPRSADKPAAWPDVQMIDLRSAPMQHGLTEPLRAALADTLARGEQSLVFINRRGYAPVLSCAACGWLSGCPQCAVYAAFHKTDGRMHCHHCGWQQPVPRACPVCGNRDLSAVGHGTQRIEEALAEALPQARIARIDRDSTRRRHAAEEAFDAVHAGEVDVLVGTQMVAKGHDFRRVSLVAILNCDAQLVSPDFRAPERLFATLLQVAGRAGRSGLASRVLVQTRFPDHPLLAALAQRDFVAFADRQWAERRAARLPPAVHQALLMAEAGTLAAALDFLAQARARVAEGSAADGVSVYEPVPMPLAKRAGIHRAQLLVEAVRRSTLQSALRSWLPQVRTLAAGHRPRVRWQIEVDPQQI
jgi:primosomal protein N' (replication factor Y)